MRTKLLAALLGGVGLVGLVACDGGDFNSVVPLAPNVLIGTFALRSINGSAVPTAVLDSTLSPDTVIVQSGAITINADNTFSDIVAFIETFNGASLVRTVTCSGTYTRIGTAFTFVEILQVPSCGRTFTGIVNGNTLSSVVGVLPAGYSTQP